MQRSSAPGYDDERIEALYRDGLLLRTISVENGEIVGVYSLSDKAAAILDAQDQHKKEFAEQYEEAARENRASRRHDFFVVLVSSAATLVVDFLLRLIWRLWP